MMYDEQDKVYVFNGKQLYPDPFTITYVSDDEEFFKLTGTDETGNTIDITATRSHIMDQDELDKIGKLLVHKHSHHIVDSSEIEEIDDYLNEDDGPEFATVIFDSTIDGFIQNIANNFQNIFHFQKWFFAMFSHYSPNGIYCLNDEYYVVLPN